MADRFYDRKKLMDILRKNRDKLKRENQRELPDDYFIKCPSCKEVLVRTIVSEKHEVCPKCGHHFKMPLSQRLFLLFGEEYELLSPDPIYDNPIDFPGYLEKCEDIKTRTGAKEAAVWGVGSIEGYQTAFFFLDPAFLMGSMGSYVGEMVTMAFEYAVEKGLPVLGISASGGARMQEGIVSLMQMAKTMLAVNQHDEAGLLYVSLLTHPTTGGVSASFALMGDVNLAEPEALIGFAGPRVIKETIGEELPEGFQTAEFLRDKGFIDEVVPRHKLRKTMEMLLRLHQKEGDHA